MSIIAKDSDGGTTKYLHPEGQFVAVCIDVIDLGMVDVTYEGETKKQHKIVIRFWCGEYNETNEPLFVGRRFTLSLRKTSALRPFLEAWRGQAFTAAELEGFDLEKLIGVPALLQVTHAQVGDRTYANITSAMKPMRGMESIRPLADYVRAKDRTEAPVPQPEPCEDDDELPF